MKLLNTLSSLNKCKKIIAISFFVLSSLNTFAVQQFSEEQTHKLYELVQKGEYNRLKVLVDKGYVKGDHRLFTYYTTNNHQVNIFQIAQYDEPIFWEGEERSIFYDHKITENHIKIFELFVKAGSDINLASLPNPDTSRRTPLFSLVESSQGVSYYDESGEERTACKTKLVKKFIEWGANANASYVSQIDGRTSSVLEYVPSDCGSIMIELLNAGAKPLIDKSEKCSAYMTQGRYFNPRAHERALAKGEAGYGFPYLLRAMIKQLNEEYGNISTEADVDKFCVSLL